VTNKLLSAQQLRLCDVLTPSPFYSAGYTGYEEYSVSEVIREIEYQGASPAVLELIKRIEQLIEESEDEHNH
jgi:hypothetical protein